MKSYTDYLRVALGPAVKFSSNEMVIVEITEKCVNLCSYCYKKGVVGCNKPHVPKEVIIQRLHWIKTFTNARGVTFLGGEPLLVPHLQELIDEALGMGLAVNIITSGKIVDEQQYCRDNIEIIGQYWATGKIGLSLSYHPGNNEKYYFSFLERMKEAVKVCLKEEAISSGTLELKSTATFGKKESADFLEKIRAFCERIVAGLNYDKASLTLDKTGEVKPLSVYMDGLNEELLRHFRPFSDNFTHGLTFTTEATGLPFGLYLRIWGSNEVTKNCHGHYLARVGENWSRKGGAVACGAMSVNVKEWRMQVELGGMSIMSDGGLTFGLPQCFVGKSARLGYIDKMPDRETVYQTISNRVGRIKEIVIRAKSVENRKYSLGRCWQDPKSEKELADGSLSPAYLCYSCALSGRTGACTVCANTDFEK